MVNLILTNTLDSKHILDKVKTDFEKNKISGNKIKQLIIVPDRVVLEYEIKTLEYLNIPGSFDIEVASFQTLADKIFGRDAEMMLNTQTEIMLIRKVIEENRANLLYYKESSVYVGFAQEVSNLLSLIRTNRISLKDIERLVKTLPPKYENKTKDILLIYREYMEQLKLGFKDPISKVEALIDNFKESVYAKKNYNVYISEFIDFSAQEMDVISEFVRYCNNVYITLPDTHNENSGIFPKSTKEKLKKLIEKTIDSNYIHEEFVESDLKGDFKLLQENLYSYVNKASDPQSECHNKDREVLIANPLNLEREVKELAIRIKRHVKNDNVRYKDIAVACGDVDSYSSLIETTFKKYDIPYYSDESAALTNQNITKIIIFGINVMLNGYSQDCVIQYAKELQMLIPKYKLDIFEEYCLRFGITYEGMFSNKFTLCDKGQENNKDIAEEVRGIVMESLAPLKKLDFISSEKSKAKVDRFIDGIRDFLESIDAKDIVYKLSKKQHDNNDLVESSITKQSYDYIDETLDQMSQILGKCEMHGKEFFRIFESTVLSVAIKTIPMYIDCVYIGDCEKTRYTQKDYIYIIGAEEGNFPIEHGETGLLTPQDFDAWSRENVSIYPNFVDTNIRSKLFALMVMIKPKKQLVISYPKYNLAGEQTTPSMTINYIQRIINDKTLDYIEEPQNDWTIEDYKNYYICEKCAIEDFVELKNLVECNMLEYSDIVKKVLASLYKIASEIEGNDSESVKKLINQDFKLETNLKGDFSALPKDHVSVSIFETYFACPFKYYASYILALKERKIAGTQYRDIGNLVHKVMELYFREKDYDKKSEEEVKAFVEEVIAKEIHDDNDYSYLTSDTYALFRERLIDNVSKTIVSLVSKMENSNFKPYKTEQAFNSWDKDAYPPMVLNTSAGKLEVVGKIDRIDKFNDKAFIIDYKTKSSMKFNLENIIIGDKIQLPVYLKKLIDAEKLTPAGMFYLLVNSKKFTDDDIANIKYQGIFNNDLETVHDFDTSLSDVDSKGSNLFPISKKKDKSGSVSYNALTDSLDMSTTEFNKLFDYVEKLITKATEEILSGYVAVSPKGDDVYNEPSVCKYCKYKQICNISNNKNKIRIVKLSDGKDKDKKVKEILFNKEEDK